jgi:addiction module HigA family antidote
LVLSALERVGNASTNSTISRDRSAAQRLRYANGRAVTADTALRLARFFNTSPEFWMHLHAMHDLTKTRLEYGKAIARDIRPRAA